MEQVYEDRFSRRYGFWRNKIYEVDPLVCPKCQGKIKIIVFIEDEEVIKKILGLWEVKKRAPSKIKSPPFAKDIRHEPADAGHPHFYFDPEYPVEMYIRQ